MPLPGPEPGSDSSILKELVFNQYQAIILGGAAALSLIALSPVPLLVWLGGELVLLPLLDSGRMRRLVRRRRNARARREAEANRARILDALEPSYAKRYAAMEHLCRLIEGNYQGLHGMSQVFLAEQRGKLDVILDGCLHRMLALQRYERMLSRKTPASVEGEMRALQKNLELKRRLLESYEEARGSMKAFASELDSLSSLLEVLHQNSISMRDPQAISQELDAIVRQSEDSERVVREMEALLRSGASDWSEELPALERAAGDRGRTRSARPKERSR